ncbi:nucleotidyltransferase family protein [Curvibacter sp. APW13]|uniref:nucleotidyltransferase family protein n=1 Tax=Curvibacter sp. APW13 TaxID=3077236 RepID=UPI0028DF3751|nr:nucleotidyltransferase family protein [Curvibacter sp. APW13]MDT8990516.1 nucleotidyltransferase family protein [Curvibacter sp. APW13]
MNPTSVPAMLLAAGRGERMRPLTDSTPKPLLQVRGKPLMQWPLEALARAGCPRVLINTAWLGEQISATFGDNFDPHPAYNKREPLSFSEQLQHTMVLQYSHEGIDFGGALETAGGIVRALPRLCSNVGRSHDVFWALAGDVYAPDFPFAQADVDRFLASTALAHIWLVPNPEHNPGGDFGLEAQTGLALNLHATSAAPRYTFSTIGLYRSGLFAPPYCHIPPGNPHGVKAALAPVLRAAMDAGRVTATLYEGRWTDVGTPERLAQLNAAD